MVQRILTFLSLLFLSTAALATDNTKYNVNGDTAVQHVSFNLVNNPRVLVLDGPVGKGNAGPLTDKLKELALASKRPIYLVINTPGGSVNDGLALINAMKGAKASLGVKTTCLIDRYAYSMGALIAVFCDRTFMSEQSSLMFHEAAFGTQEQITHMASRTAFMVNYMNEFNYNIAAAIGIAPSEYNRLINAEWWLTARQAARYGVVDGIVDNLFHNTEPPKSVLDLLFERTIRIVPNWIYQHEPIR